MQIIRSKSAILLALLVFAAVPAHAQVARVLEVKGTTLVERAGQPPRILGTNEPLDVEQVVTVARDSHAILEFSDKSRVTLRPGTVFRIDAYRADKPESMILGLLKGGLRAITGLIGKRNPGAVKFQTAVATIGIRGTEFDARLCEKDCAEEDRLRPELRSLGKPVARVVEMKGTVAAARAGERARVLVPGTAVYERDGVAAGANSHAVLAFSDGSRISLAENSRLAILAYRFDGGRRAGNAEIHHISGVARVQSGAIAKQGPEYYRFVTPLGEVRPHGTLWDSVAGGAKKVADEGADTVRETGETVAGAVQDTVGQAAQTALNAAIRPIMETMSVLMTNLRDHPPTTEAGWNDLMSQMTRASDRLHGALDEAIRVGGSVVESREFKSMVGLALAAELEMLAVGAALPTIQGADAGIGFYAALITGVQAARSNTYQSESLALVGLSGAELDRVSYNRYAAHVIIETEAGGYLASQGNAAANDFFSKAKAAAEELRLRARQAEEAAARAAAEAEQRAMEDAVRAEEEALTAKREAERLAAEAEALRQQQLKKLKEGQAELEKAAGKGADAAKEIGEAVVETGQDAANQAAQAALDAATAPIMREMTRLMSEIKNNPPTTEAGWNELMSQMTEMSSRLDDAMDSVVSANVAILNSDAHKAMLGVGLAGKLHMYAVLAVERGEIGDAAFVALRMHMAAMTVANYESLAALGLSFADLMRVRESQYEAHFIIQTEIMSHLTSQGSAAAREFFAEAQAAGQAVQQRAQQAEAAAQRAAAEAERLAAEAEELRRRQAKKLDAGVKKGQEVANSAVQKTVKLVQGVLGNGGRLEALDDVASVGSTLATLHGTDVDARDEVVGLLGDLYQRLGQAFTKFAADRSADSTTDLQPAETETRTSTTTTTLDDGTVVTITESDDGPNGSSTVREERRPDGTVERKTNSDNGHGETVNMTETWYPSGKTSLSVQRTSSLNAYYSRSFTFNPDGSYEEVVREASPEQVRYYKKNVYFKDDGSVIVQPQVDIVLDAAGVHAHSLSDHIARPDGSSGANAKIDLEIANGRATMSVVGAQSISADGAKRESPVFEAEAGPNGVRVTYEGSSDTIEVGGGDATASQGQGSSASQTHAESAMADSTSPSTLHVWDGSVEVAGRTIRKGESLRAASDGQMVSGPSSSTPVTNAPRPDLVKVDPDLFRDGGKTVDPGLYVWVRDGAVSLEQGGRQVEVAAGNAAFATKDKMTLLDHVPNFMRFDQTPPPDNSGKGFTPPPFVLNDGSVAGSCAVK